MSDLVCVFTRIFLGRDSQFFFLIKALVNLLIKTKKESLVQGKDMREKENINIISQ